MAANTFRQMIKTAQSLFCFADIFNDHFAPLVQAACNPLPPQCISRMKLPGHLSVCVLPPTFPAGRFPAVFTEGAAPTLLPAPFPLILIRGGLNHLPHPV